MTTKNGTTPPPSAEDMNPHLDSVRPDFVLERNCIAAIYAGGAATLHDVRPLLTAEDFREASFRRAFDAFERIVGNGGQLSPDALALALGQVTRNMTGRDFAAYLSETPVSPATARQYAARIAAAGKMRRTRQALAELTETASKMPPGAEADDFIADALRRFMALETPSSGGQQLSELAPAHLAKMHLEYENPNSLRGLSTGLNTLNGMIRGLCPGNLIIVAAGSGIGKSTLAMNVAVSAAKISNASVHLYSLEMEKDEILWRMAWAESRIPTEKFFNRTLTTDDWRRVEEAHYRLGNLPIMLDDNPNITVPQIAADCRRARFTGKLDLIVVDYAQLVAPVGTAKGATRQQEVSSVSRAMKALAGELHVPVVALSQLNDEGRLRESRDLFNDANVVLMLESSDDSIPAHFEEDEPIPYVLEVRKNRNGATGKIGLAFQAKYSLFREMELGRF